MDTVRQDLTRELRASRVEQWAQGRVRSDPRQTVRWTLVASLQPLAAGPLLEIGLTEDGQWVVAAADGSIADVEATENYLPLFPLLEFSLGEARENLEAQFRVRGLNEKWLQFFPFEELVVAALMNRPSSWAGLAFQWLDNLGPSETLCAALDLVRNTGMTQQQRHQATRILAEWRRRSTV